MQRGNSWRQFMIVLLLIGFVFGYSEFSQGLSKEDSASEHHPIIKKMSTLQVPFIANKGQVDEEVSFYAKTFGCTLFVTSKGELVYVLERSPNAEAEGSGAIVFKERLLNAKDISPEGREKAQTRVNYFVGDKRRWKTNIPTYNQVTFDRPYKGIEVSLKAYGKIVEKVFTIYPEGKVSDIRLSINGVNSLKLNANGELEISLCFGDIKFSTTVA